MYWIYSIFKFWKFGIMIGLTMALMFFMMQSNKKDGEIAELEYFIQEKVFYLDSLEDAVDVQNEMIQDLHDKDEMWDEMLKESQKRVIIIRKQEKEKVLSIIESRVGKSCPEAMDWMVDQAEGELRWEK